MTFSRRRLLAGVPVVAGMAALAACGSRDVLDVRDFGAVGDGVTDDSQAIQAAAAALRSNTTLRFPAGRYRFAQQRPPGMAAIVVSGVMNAAVDFAPGAELLMDNLDAGTGAGHGVLVRGPASRITLRNIVVCWSGDSRRSLGDGIRVEGMPDGVRAVTGVALKDCVVTNSPQTGVVMLGASNISVTGLRVTGSGADGLHFNACRHAQVRGVHTSDTGDDGLALVTYFDRERSYDEDAGTFAFPDLTPWSNTDFDIADVTVIGGRANGVRIAGARQVSMRGLEVAGVQAGAAVMVDSAEPGTDVGWHYVASRDIRIVDLSTVACHTGIHVLARPGESGAPQFTTFGVQVDDARLEGCDNWAVHIESLARQPVQGVRVARCAITSRSSEGGNGGVGVDRARDVALGEVSIQHAQPVVTVRTREADRLAVDRLSVSITKTEPHVGAAPPLVALHGSGVLKSVEVGWPGAPPGWSAVKVSAAERCGEQPVVIKQFTADTPHGDSAVHCS